MHSGAQAELVGEHARQVQERLRERLAAAAPGYDWTLEARIGPTPVDVVGTAADHVVCVELEWRRADPADNAAKLFRHLAEGGALDGRRATVVQVFSGYYDLVDGDVSAKRKNADFVGRAAAHRLDAVDYEPVSLAIDPPTADGAMPSDWEPAVDDAVETIAAALDAGEAAEE